MSADWASAPARSNIGAQPLIPIFRSFDSELARKFYVDWLGFRIDWEHRFSPGAPLYMQISRDAAVIHISEHYRDCSPGAKALIAVADIEAFHRELVARPNSNMGAGIETTFWRARVVEVSDPFGNLLCFNQRLDPDAAAISKASAGT